MNLSLVVLRKCHFIAFFMHVLYQKLGVFKNAKLLYMLFKVFSHILQYNSDDMSLFFLLKKICQPYSTFPHSWARVVWISAARCLDLYGIFWFLEVRRHVRGIVMPIPDFREHTSSFLFSYTSYYCLLCVKFLQH